MYPFFNYGGFGFPQGQFSQQSPFMGGFNPYQMQGNFGGQQFSGMPNQGGFNQRQFNPPRQPRPTIGNPNIDPSQISGGFRSAIANASNQQPMAQERDNYLQSNPAFQQLNQLSSSLNGAQPNQDQLSQLQNLNQQIQQDPRLMQIQQQQIQQGMGGMGGMAAQRGMQKGAGPQAPTQDAYNNFRAMTGSPISFEEFSQSRGNKLTQQPGFGGQQTAQTQPSSTFSPYGAGDSSVYTTTQQDMMGGNRGGGQGFNQVMQGLRGGKSSGAGQGGYGGAPGFGGQQFGGFQQPQFNPFQQQFSQMSRFQPQQQFGGFQQQFNPYQQQYGGFSQFPQFQTRGLLY
jgi:hypothetical protein